MNLSRLFQETAQHTFDHLTRLLKKWDSSPSFLRNLYFMSPLCTFSWNLARTKTSMPSYLSVISHHIAIALGNELLRNFRKLKSVQRTPQTPLPNNTLWCSTSTVFILVHSRQINDNTAQAIYLLTTAVWTFLSLGRSCGLRLNRKVFWWKLWM